MVVTRLVLSLTPFVCVTLSSIHCMLPLEHVEMIHTGIHLCCFREDEGSYELLHTRRAYPVLLAASGSYTNGFPTHSALSFQL